MIVTAKRSKRNRWQRNLTALACGLLLSSAAFAEVRHPIHSGYGDRGSSLSLNIYSRNLHQNRHGSRYIDHRSNNRFTHSNRHGKRYRYKQYNNYQSSAQSRYRHSSKYRNYSTYSGYSTHSDYPTRPVRSHSSRYGQQRCCYGNSSHHRRNSQRSHIVSITKRH